MRIRAHVRVSVSLLFISVLAGCVSPLALERAVMEYDRKMHLIQSEMLLLNIARTKQHLPGHFTTVSSIAATFDFRVETGIIGRIGQSPDDAPVDLSLRSSVAENPTIHIIPIQGEEFAKRLLRSIDESTLHFVIHQGMDVAGILRLVGDAILLEVDGELVTFPNTPSRPEAYREFRRRVLHLSALNASHQLAVEPITYEQPWPDSPGGQLHPRELTVALDRGYRWMIIGDGPTQVLSRRVTGRVVIANYDPRDLSTNERRQLDLKADQFPRNYVLVDIRAGFPGGEYPFHGWIKLRSFRAVVEFLGHGIEDDVEFHVDADPRTGSLPYSPPKILEIRETATRPEDAALSVPLNGRIYSISRNAPHDLEMFRMLYRLFQLTVTDVTKVPVTPITIAK